MAVRRFKPSGARSSPRARTGARKAPRIGFLRPLYVERAFLALLYLTLLVLVLLSVIGTYYGLASDNAPLLRPAQILVDIRTNTDRLWVAITIQAFLTLAQYGARQLARHDPRWWFLYLAALAVSVYYNFQAYWIPLNTLTLWPITAVAIIAGDVLPEFIAIRHEE